MHAILQINGHFKQTPIIVDLGADAEFIDLEFAKLLNIQLQSTPKE